MLNKIALRESLTTGIENTFITQMETMKESDNPKDIIKAAAESMAKVISDAVEAYVKSGDIVVGPSNITVAVSTAPGAGVVAPLKPAKIV
jgi:hypothetical protein